MTAAPCPILLYGPTASGKSALAMTLADRLGGAIVNADSQQGFGDWRILTARPSPQDEAAVPHFLYGHLPAGASWSAGQWLAELRTALAAIRDANLRPIITGGTGLYFRALTEGLAPIPPVPPDLRAEGEVELQRLGLRRFANALAERDPKTAENLDLSNPRRVLRAWEVLEATGTPLSHWQARTEPPLLPLDQTTPILLTPPRDWLYRRCETRLQTMLKDSVLDEVRAVLAKHLPETLPAMKAVGAREFVAHIEGRTTLDHALEKAATATRRYAKRQLTWARGRMAGWHAIPQTDPRTRFETALAAIDA